MQHPPEIRWEEVEDIIRDFAEGFEFYHTDCPDLPLAALIGFEWTQGSPAVVRVRRPSDERTKRAIEEVRALIEHKLKGHSERNVKVRLRMITC